MILADSSPFYRLPATIKPRQGALLEAIRYSIDMIDLAHERLRAVVIEVSALHASGSRFPRPLFTAPFLDAWTIVDIVARLQKLLAHFGNKSERNPAIRALVREADDVEELRHSIQHLDHRGLGEVVAQELPIWGQLSWIAITGERSCKLQTMVSGVIKNGAYVLPNPLDYGTLQGPIAQLHLAAFGRRVSLSLLVEKVARLARLFEQKMLEQFGANPPTGGADVFLSLDVETT